MNKVQRHQLVMAVSAGVLLSILAAYIVGNMNSFFGVYIPREMLDAINTGLALGFTGLAISLHLQRKNPALKQLVRTLAAFLAYALFIVGWRFVAGETTMAGGSNDGFTVTGGFMMLVSGIGAGYLFGTRGKK